MRRAVRGGGRPGLPPGTPCSSRPRPCTWSTAAAAARAPCRTPRCRTRARRRRPRVWRQRPPCWTSQLWRLTRPASPRRFLTFFRGSAPLSDRPRFQVFTLQVERERERERFRTDKEPPSLSSLCVPRICSRQAPAQRQQQGNPTVWRQPVSLTSLSARSRGGMSVGPSYSALGRERERERERETDGAQHS